MKTKFFILTLLAFSFVACQSNAPEGETVEATEAEQVEETTAAATAYAVDTETSMINWKGTEAVGDGHYGVISLQEGSLQVEGDKLVGGSFVIDMNSINVQDLEGGRKEKLEGHLKNNDFFLVEEFPTATFTITGVEAVQQEGANHLINGNLMMRDSVKNIQIPAMVSMENGMITAETPDFVINRTDWGVQYRSTLAGTVKDKLINDNIGLSVKLVAKQ